MQAVRPVGTPLPRHWGLEKGRRSVVWHKSCVNKSNIYQSKSIGAQKNYLVLSSLNYLGVSKIDRCPIVSGGKELRWYPFANCTEIERCFNFVMFEWRTTFRASQKRLNNRIISVYFSLKKKNIQTEEGGEALRDHRNNGCGGDWLISGLIGFLSWANTRPRNNCAIILRICACLKMIYLPVRTRLTLTCCSACSASASCGTCFV